MATESRITTDPFTKRGGFSNQNKIDGMVNNHLSSYNL